MRYHHHFDVRIANDFHSDIEDFDEAFEAWSEKFTDRSALRKRLLTSDESLKTILQGIVFSETLDADEGTGTPTPD